MRARRRCTNLAPVVAPVLALVLLFVPTVAAGTAVAASSGGSNSTKTKVQQQLDEVTRQQQAALAQLQQAKAQKAAVDAKVADIDTQLSSAQARLDPLQSAAAQLGATYSALVVELQAKQAELQTAREKLDNSAAQMYRDARQGDTYDILSVSQPETLVVANKYLDRISNQRNRVVQQVTALRNELDAQRKTVADEKAKADAAAAAAQAERDRLASLRSQAEPARAQAAAAESDESAAVANLGQQKAQLESQLNALQAQSDSIGGTLRARGGPVGKGQACQFRPVAGGITSPYGYRQHPILNRRILHAGDDLAAGMGTPIHACLAGTIVIAGPQGGYGNAVVIDHGNGMATLYGHQSRIAVSVGQHVAAGQVIGYAGMTGLATGPHVHFEVRINGTPIDPTAYL